MTNREKIESYNPEAVLWDGCDDALIGMTNNGVAVYSIGKLQEIFLNQFKESAESDDEALNDAIEWVEYNILGAYVGEHTPIHIMEIEYI